MGPISGFPFFGFHLGQGTSGRAVAGRGRSRGGGPWVCLGAVAAAGWVPGLGRWARRLRLGGISLLVAVIPVPNSGLRGELGGVLPRMLPQKILIEAKFRS